MSSRGWHLDFFSLFFFLWWYTIIQFHQHFMSSFCTDILLPKNFEAKMWVEKSFKKQFCTKKAYVKCWWNWHMTDHPGENNPKSRSNTESINSEISGLIQGSRQLYQSQNIFHKIFLTLNSNKRAPGLRVSVRCP